MKPRYLSLFLAAICFFSLNLRAQTPCSGVPPVPTITPDSVSVCPGTAVTLTLNGVPPNTGITIEWNESPPGAGNWNAIAGATGATYTAVTTSPMYYFANVVCANSSGLAQSNAALIIPACPTADSVWPGDADYNFTVDNYDPLAVAVAYGVTGSPRTGATINWQAEYSADWVTSFATGSNHKHGDCNGDGIIDNSDLTAITNNFGLTHLRGYSHNGNKTTSFPDIYFDMTAMTITQGSTVTIPLKFGSSPLPVTNFYGVAGTAVIMGQTPTNMPSMSVDPTWFGTGANPLSFSKATNVNTVYWTFARTDHQNGSGNGILGNISFTLPSSALGQMVMHLQDIKLIDNNGTELTDYNVADDTAAIVESGIAPGSSGIQNMSIVPNPSADKAGLAFTLYRPMDARLDISDLTGRCLWTMAIEGNEGQQLISLPAERFSAGIYLVKLSSNTQSYSKVVKWIRQ